MRYSIVIALALLAASAQAKGPKTFQSGTLLQMDSVKCGVDENSGKSITGEIIGTDSGHKKTRELLCQEYILQTDHILYRIRPKEEKHPALLPVGGRAQFRMEKDKMVLRVEDMDNKDRDYIVVSATPRPGTETTASK